MIVAARLQSLMDANGLSQSGLARRVGVTQATIYKLLSGVSVTSRHLPKIARALGTTAAYLEGEIDDPDAGAPTTPELTWAERDLLERVRRLSGRDFALLLQLTNRLLESAEGATPSRRVEDMLPPEGALIPMFEGLLLAMDRSQSVDAQAELLARRLPIGLAQLRDLVTADGRPIKDELRPDAIRLEDALPPVGALAQMFAGLLMAMDLSAPVDEQARLLAQRLPIGLSQLQDLQPASATGADTKPRRARSTRAPARP